MRNRSDIGEILKECRLRANYSQDTLASLLKVDQSFISRVERGEVNPAYVVVKQWARETKGEDLISADLGGKESWRKMKMLEEKFEKMKELVSFMKIRRKACKRSL